MVLISCAAVEETSVDKQVVDVKHTNPAGIGGKQPQDGVGLIVKNCNDGSRTTMYLSP